MYNYLFAVTDENSEYEGEEFFVQCDSYEEAWEIARGVFEAVMICYGKYSDEEAEWMGFDTY